MGPNRARQAANFASTAARSVTSRRWDWISTPAAVTRATVAAMASSRGSTVKTRAPSSARRTQVARPLPQHGPTPLPVTITAFRSSRLAIRCVLPLTRRPHDSSGTTPSGGGTRNTLSVMEISV